MSKTPETDNYEFVGDSYVPDEVAAALRQIEQTAERHRSHRGLLLLGGVGVASVAAGVATKYYQLRHAA